MAAARRAAPAPEAETPDAAATAAEADAPTQAEADAPTGDSSPADAAEQPAETNPAPEAAEEPPAEEETVSGLAPGTLVVIESIIYAGRVYEPGQPLPSTFPADVAERRIADGSVARM